MVDPEAEYLAAEVINAGRPVTFKLLSRQLKVHVDQAKGMLFRFHRKQNAKKPGSVHATYHIIGTPKPEPKPDAKAHANGDSASAQDGEDTVMQSSPPMSSMQHEEEEQESAGEIVKRTAITIAQEQNLEAAKSSYETISKLFVYSLEPGPMKDTSVLSECYRRVEKEFSHEDPLEMCKVYGTAHNPNVTRRTLGKSAPPPVPVPNKAAANQDPRPSSIQNGTATKAAPTKGRKGSGSNETPKPTPQVDAAAIPAKAAESKGKKVRVDKSDIFASFAKAKPKKKVAEDQPMEDMEEEEQEEDFVEAKEVEDGATKKARAERAAKLKNMFNEDEDEPMNDAPSPTAETEQQEEAEAASPIDKPAPVPHPEEEQQQEFLTVSNGRRRGKRRVMTKRTHKDDEGFLVTKEVPIWEEFSEDEPAPKKAKIAVAPSGGKGKKAAGGAKGGAGQGNIMSFFGKK
ncbi:hypothetical protein K402DRAFT_389742 [Aulographum hederae CBS 113979]|uniref:DNA polymerase delta subunit 3 n=1 Tax=Aulographum hederae CBS 113979 TaxID=1176131 RepID=A0A6G1HC84_9PEZI|nr:hypothetical protein K402DRAFT_389742 [Aulographum hederae CBS 113979]